MHDLFIAFLGLLFVFTGTTEILASKIDKLNSTITPSNNTKIATKNKTNRSITLGKITCAFSILSIALGSIIMVAGLVSWAYSTNS